jgi:hypothetical protein
MNIPSFITYNPDFGYATYTKGSPVTYGQVERFGKLVQYTTLKKVKVRKTLKFASNKEAMEYMINFAEFLKSCKGLPSVAKFENFE